MIKLNKRVLFFPLLLFCIGLFSSNTRAISLYKSVCLQSQYTSSLKNDDVVHHQNNLLNPHFRFHRGIFGSSIDVSKLYTGAQPFLKLEDNSYEVSHYSWYLLSEQEKVPNHIFLSTPGSLRAPPLV
jgi:hypothetical protein